MLQRYKIFLKILINHKKNSKKSLHLKIKKFRKLNLRNSIQVYSGCRRRALQILGNGRFEACRILDALDNLAALDDERRGNAGHVIGTHRP